MTGSQEFHGFRTTVKSDDSEYVHAVAELVAAEGNTSADGRHRKDLVSVASDIAKASFTMENVGDLPVVAVELPPIYPRSEG